MRVAILAHDGPCTRVLATIEVLATIRALQEGKDVEIDPADFQALHQAVRYEQIRGSLTLVLLQIVLFVIAGKRRSATRAAGSSPAPP